MFEDTKLKKLTGSLPWLARYPFWRLADFFRTRASEGPRHVILTIANHFEPGYNEEPNEHGGFGITLDWSTQMSRLDHWCEQARKIGAAVRDHDGTPFNTLTFILLSSITNLCLTSLPPSRLKVLVRLKFIFIMALINPTHRNLSNACW